MEDETGIESEDEETSCPSLPLDVFSCCPGIVYYRLWRRNLPLFAVSFFLFCVLAAAGVTLCEVFSVSRAEDRENRAMDLAVEAGDRFSKELELAVLPLFSIAQFATELSQFSRLTNEIGYMGNPNALPSLNTKPVKRNVTNVCDRSAVVQRFEEIASKVRASANMDGVLHSIQLAPAGVICLIHPMTVEGPTFFLNHSGALGVDLLNDPFHQYIARESLKSEKISIAGPRPLTQCPHCGLYFIARLSVSDDIHTVEIDGTEYNRYGFATVLINWDELVRRTAVREQFDEQGSEFQLTRTDYNYNDDAGQYDQDVVVLAQSTNFGGKALEVSAALNTTNNEWVMVVQYDDGEIWKPILITTSFLVALGIAALVYTILIQKQVQFVMKGQSMAQAAKVEIERNMTAYFAHELRNPVNAIDCALSAMPDDLEPNIQDLVTGMRLCTAFMASIMNNLLDVRKIEEGKMILRSSPLSLTVLINEVRRMSVAAVRPGVELVAISNVGDRDTVLGDTHRLQQILTNLVSNAIKYTMEGSIKIIVSWVGDVVLLQCKDTGPGIPKSQQADMFQRFTTRGGAPGSGLGLAIAKQMVSLMGGSIHFESDPSIRPGTTCVVKLPLLVCDDCDDAQTNAVVTTTKTVEPIQEEIRILLVDDIEMNRTMEKRRLRKNIAPNSIIHVASTGEEALAMCSTFEFDVVIMDQWMEMAGGVMVGTDAVTALRRQGSKAVIVGCSGNELGDEFLAAGADFAWSKPMPSNQHVIEQLRKGLLQKESDEKKHSSAFRLGHWPTQQ